MLKDVEVNDLKCLILWPVGSPEYYIELRIAMTMLDMCKDIGYGRVPQLAAQIEEIWRDPAKKDEYEKWNQKHLELLRIAAEWNKDAGKPARLEGK